MSNKDISYIKQFNKEIEIIKALHGDQVRRFTLAPYYTHPIRVATLVMKFKESHEIDAIIKAALFHDTLEDTNINYNQLLELEGPLVASLVLEVTNDSEQLKLIGKSKYLCEKVVSLSSWALVIKLCDRLDNVSDFIFADNKFVTKYRIETYNIIDTLEQHYNLTDTHKNIIKYIKRELIHPFYD
jgi:(p)ppGpp synthase/HD superfamily hydrolase